MPIFICSECGFIDNTATSNAWAEVREKKSLLCSKCKWEKLSGVREKRIKPYDGMELMCNEYPYLTYCYKYYETQLFIKPDLFKKYTMGPVHKIEDKESLEKFINELKERLEL
jgi:hypothetical protein